MEKKTIDKKILERGKILDNLKKSKSKENFLNISKNNILNSSFTLNR